MINQCESSCIKTFRKGNVFDHPNFINFKDSKTNECHRDSNKNCFPSFLAKEMRTNKKIWVFFRFPSLVFHFILGGHCCLFLNIVGMRISNPGFRYKWQGISESSKEKII